MEMLTKVKIMINTYVLCGFVIVYEFHSSFEVAIELRAPYASHAPIALMEDIHPSESIELQNRQDAIYPDIRAAAIDSDILIDEFHSIDDEFENVIELEIEIPERGKIPNA